MRSIAFGCITVNHYASQCGGGGGTAPPSAVAHRRRRIWSPDPCPPCTGTAFHGPSTSSASSYACRNRAATGWEAAGGAWAGRSGWGRRWQVSFLAQACSRPPSPRRPPTHQVAALALLHGLAGLDPGVELRPERDPHCVKIVVELGGRKLLVHLPLADFAVRGLVCFRGEGGWIIWVADVLFCSRSIVQCPPPFCWQHCI